jgi:uncharacterized protein (TIGR03435 family)
MQQNPLSGDYQIMLKRVLVLSALVLGSLSAQAPAFEVATIRPAAELNPQAIMAGKMRVGMKIDAGRVDIGFFSLKELIPLAYGMKAFQVQGPDWLNQQRFDISATLPEGATKEQVPAMLQTLLAERFHLKVHREKKDENVYALVQGKDGHKLKPSVEEVAPAAPASGQEGAKDAPKSDMSVSVNGQQMNINRTANGAVMTGGADTGTVKISMGQGGMMRYEMARVTMAKLVEQLTPLLDRPVIDATEMTGAYQVAMEMSMMDMMAAARAQGANIPGMPAMPPGAGGAAGGPVASDPSGGSIFASVQQMGLRLDSRKAPIEHIVVDSVDKNPTEN